VSLSDGRFVFTGGRMATLESGEATYRSCSTTTGYSYVGGRGYHELSVDVRRLTKNQCLKWNTGLEDRYARVVFRKMIKGGVLLDVAVWYGD
jgi:hypothetical protein